MKSYTASPFAPLLKDFQKHLADGLNSLGGKQYPGPREGFLLFTCKLINTIADGYILLREALRIDASKLLIRPAIESMFRIAAVLKEPTLVFRIAFSESEEDKKWSAADPVGQQMVATNWDSFKTEYQAKFPTEQLVEQKISMFEVARQAGLEGYYNSHYRLYCQFTHGALRATVGALDSLEGEDDRTMTLCVLQTLAVLQTVGACPQYAELNQRLTDLYQSS